MRRAGQTSAPAVEAAQRLIAQLNTEEESVQRLRELARALSSAALNVECAIANTRNAARKVIENPSAENRRDLKTSETHLEMFLRKSMQAAHKRVVLAAKEGA